MNEWKKNGNLDNVFFVQIKEKAEWEQKIPSFKIEMLISYC